MWILRNPEHVPDPPAHGRRSMGRGLVVVVLALATLVTGGPLARQARAEQGPPSTENCVAGGAMTSDGPWFRICGVPDFDQQRAHVNQAGGLPNSGSMYCVPTSTFDLLAYIADHGAPEVKPGPGYSDFSASPSTYADVTNGIEHLGDLMGTDPEDGTGGTAERNGTMSWLAESYPYGSWSEAAARFAVTNIGVVTLSSGFRIGPTPGNLAGLGAQGSLLTVGVGWYSGFSGENYKRDGGHAMALVGASSDSSGGHLIVHDPADDGANGTESGFTADPLTAYDRLTTFRTEGVYDIEGVLWQVSDYGDAAFIDGAMAITPKFALLPDINTSHLTLVRPSAFDGPSTIDLGSMEGVLDYQIDPTSAWHPVLLDDGTIAEVSGIDGSRRTIEQIAGARGLVLDNDARLVVLADDGLHRVGRLGGRTGGGVVASDAETITYDPIADQIVALDRDAKRLSFLDDDLVPVASIDVPELPDPGDPVEVRIGVGPTGKPVIHVDGTSELLEVDPSTRVPTLRRVTLGDGTQAFDGLVVDDSGIAYVTRASDNTVRAFDTDGVEVESPFTGVVVGAGPGLRVLQSATLGEIPTGNNILPHYGPTLSIADMAQEEGTQTASRAKYSTFRVAVTLSEATDERVDVRLDTTSGTAIDTGDLADYAPISNRLVSFEPGQTVAYASVTVRADTHIEANDYFAVALSTPTGAVIGDDSAVVTILNDDRRHPKGT